MWSDAVSKFEIEIGPQSDVLDILRAEKINYEVVVQDLSEMMSLGLPKRMTGITETEFDFYRYHTLEEIESWCDEQENVYDFVTMTVMTEV